MALQIISQDISGTGPLFTPAAGTTLFFATGVNATATGGIVVDTQNADVGVFVSSGAHIHGSFSGLRMIGTATAGKWVEIEQGALVSGGSYGVALSGDRLAMTNHGQITGGNYGMLYHLAEAGHSGKIVNSGKIVGNTGLFPDSPVSMGTLTIVNSGLIWGNTVALDGANGTVYRITNSGEFRGIVELGDGKDLVDNVKGRITGEIQMLGGDDTLRPGAKVENANGGAGVDTLDFSKSGAVKVFLADSAANRGVAAGDTYTGFENIRGSASGADRLEGDDFANRLEGQGGKDTLKGGLGKDTLVGGAGADKLFGGAGADLFVFTSVKDSTVAAGGRDTIFDFLRGAGDKIGLKGIDANTKSGGDQAFKFIGTDAFHNKAGELRYEKKSGDTHIFGDVNGDGKADFSIVLADLSLTMKATDFIL